MVEGYATRNVDNNNIDGTTNYVTKWTGPHTIGNSQIFDNATGVGIATTSPASGVKLDVNGKVKMTGFQLGSSATAGYVLTLLTLMEMELGSRRVEEEQVVGVEMEQHKP